MQKEVSGDEGLVEIGGRLGFVWTGKELSCWFSFPTKHY